MHSCVSGCLQVNKHWALSNPVYRTIMQGTTEQNSYIHTILPNFEEISWTFLYTQGLSQQQPLLPQFKKKCVQPLYHNSKILISLNHNGVHFALAIGEKVDFATPIQEHTWQCPYISNIPGAKAAAIRITLVMLVKIWYEWGNLYVMQNVSIVNKHPFVITAEMHKS